MDVSSFLTILLLAAVGFVDASGHVEYFNVSKALVQQGEAITFRCGGTRERGEDGEVLSLMLHIRKWFTGSERKWLLAVNEQVEVLRDADRYESKLRRLGLVREVEFTIFDAQPGDTGNYTCHTDRNNITVFVDVISEPIAAVLRLNATMVVGRMEVGPFGSNITGVRQDVTLGHTYGIECEIRGGNPPPNMTLAISGDMAFEGVVVTTQTERNPTDRLTVPHHISTGVLQWTPTVHDIGRPFVCSAGVENHRAVWAQFVPIVDTRAPLFGCADMVELKAGDNELMVSCRIVSIHEDLMSVRVRIYEGTGESFIIEPDVTSQRTEKTYEADNRYMVTVEPRPFTHSWNVTLKIMNAPTITDLGSKKIEFVAETAMESTVHGVSIIDHTDNGSDDDASTMITVSMATLLLTMVLGAFCRP